MVTKIVYSPVGFLDLRDAKNFDTRIKDELEESSHSTNSLELKFGRFVEVYAGVLGAQRFLTRYYGAQELLVRCLKRFKNLTKVRVDCDNSYIGAEDISTAFGGLHAIPPKILVYGGEDTMEPFFRGALFRAKCPITVFELGTFQHEDNREPLGQDDPRKQLPRESALRGRGLSARGFTSCFMDEESNLLKTYQQVSSKVKSISIEGLSSDVEDYSATRDLEEMGLIIICMQVCARELETLSISTFSSIVQKPDLTNFVTEIGLKGLRTFKLANFSVSEDHIVTVICSMQESVTTIELLRLYLSSEGTWLRVLGRLRSNCNFAALRGLDSTGWDGSGRRVMNALLALGDAVNIICIMFFYRL